MNPFPVWKHPSDVTKRTAFRASAFLFLALGAGLVFALRSDREYEVEVIGTLPKGMTLISRQDYQCKPFINVNLPLVGKVVYPKPVKPPASFKHQPGSAGLITGAWANHEWRIGNRKMTWRQPRLYRCGTYMMSVERFVQIPQVFGTEPLEAEVALWQATMSKQSSVRLRLPPNGQAAPKMESEVQQAGPWKIRLEPEPWVGPSFAIHMGVTAEGLSPKKAAVLELTGPDGFSFQTSGYAREIEDRKKTSVDFSSWNHRNLKATITQLDSSDVILTVRREKRKSFRRNELTTPSGKVLMFREYKGEGYLRGGGSLSETFAARTKHGFIHGWFEGKYPAPSSHLDWENLPNGTKLKATIFTIARQETVKFDLTLPDPAKYPELPLEP